MEPKHDRPSPPPSGDEKSRDEGSRDEGAGDDEASRDAAGDVTQLLQARRAGDGEASERLWAQVYDELRQMAHRRLQRERDGHPLSTTDLVHECYLELVDQTRTGWQDRLHFFATAAQVMRHLLVDHARRRDAQKRGGDAPHLDLEEATVSAEASADLFLALDEALRRLSERDERLGRVVECRFFGGMKEQEIAALLDLSKRTVRRDWRKAKGWLARAMPDEVQQHVR